MYVAPFAALVKGWLADAHHPGVTQVRTCAEIGRHEQPVGVALDLSDGWLWLLQLTGVSPDGGDVNRSDVADRPEPFDGSWEDRPDYRQAREVFEAERSGGRSGSRLPQAAVATLLDWVCGVIRQAAHPEVESVDVNERLALVVVFRDGSRVNGRSVGFMAQGSADLTQP